MSTHSYEELAALHAIARILSRPMEIRDQLEQVLAEMSERLGMKRGMISLMNNLNGEVWLEVAHGVDIENLQVSYRLGEGITGMVAQTGKPVAIPILGKEPMFLDRTGARKSLNRDELSFLCVPIIYDGRVVGILSADKWHKIVSNLERELALLSSIAELIAKAVYILSVEEENKRLRLMLSEEKSPFKEIIGQSKAMKDVYRLIEHVSMSNTTVLIYGETGTGKELVARAIHKNSNRAGGPLIMVNCAAIPDTLIESELFGYDKGAFTGAFRSYRGKFEEANGGTIFLDEVAELSSTAQAKLLRILQEKVFQPLGSSRTIKSDARVIAATNRNLELCVANGSFRKDLYYRLSVFPIYLPPLRERGNDIIMLADYFVLKYAKETGKNIRRISPAVIDAFMSHSWPGNVRELENCIERAVLLAEGDTIEMIHLPPSLQVKTREEKTKDTGKFHAIVSAQERALIIDALKEFNGNQSMAARSLGLTKRIIQYKIKKLGIDADRFRRKKSPTA
ncbi:MAG: sigma 54-interacting transcriptional regulator [Syntrophales bacterium]|nr:sigma 54-interacting transcriptional regulator [Syntrophales bacterium]